jgi:hypothetical protein
MAKYLISSPSAAMVVPDGEGGAVGQAEPASRVGLIQAFGMVV